MAGTNFLPGSSASVIDWCVDVTLGNSNKSAASTGTIKMARNTTKETKETLMILFKTIPFVDSQQ